MADVGATEWRVWGSKKKNAGQQEGKCWAAEWQTWGGGNGERGATEWRMWGNRVANVGQSNAHTLNISLCGALHKRMPAYYETHHPHKPLTKRQRQALSLTLNGATVAAIAEELDVTVQTVYRWRSLPGWAMEVEEIVKQESYGGENQIRSLLPLAMATLRTLLREGNHHVKLGAAKTVVEAHAALIDRLEQRDVLNELETQLIELKEHALSSASNQPLRYLMSAEGDDSPIDGAVINTIAHTIAHKDEA